MASIQSRISARRVPSLPPPIEPAQRHITTIRSSSIKTDTEADDLSITDVSYLASYNWLTHGKKTILIPGTLHHHSAFRLELKLLGCPPKWCPPVHVPALREDRGTYYRDKNASQYPSYPIEPSVRSIWTMHPDFDGQKIDVFACGNTMGSLISFLERKEKTFRFGTEKIGNTLFLIRRENNPNDTIDNVRGYGHTFPEVYTTWDKEYAGSESHQRLVSYSLGGLRCILRSETDGYLPQKLDGNHSLKQEGVPDRHEQLDEDRLLSLPSLSSSTTVPLSETSGIRVRRAGEVVPQSAIFDLKTRSSRSEIDMEDFIQRMVVNQTPNFVIAYHSRGVFNNIQVKDVRATIEDWEIENEELLGRLQEILTMIRTLTDRQTDGRLEVRRVADGDLAMWTDAVANRVLPPKLLAKWAGQGLFGNETLAR